MEEEPETALQLKELKACIQALDPIPQAQNPEFLLQLHVLPQPSPLPFQLQLLHRPLQLPQFL